MIGKTPSVLIISRRINPAANIAPPAKAIQSPAFSGSGIIVSLLKTTHKPPRARLTVTALSHPGFFF